MTASASAGKAKPVSLTYTTVPVDPEPLGEVGLQIKDLLYDFLESPREPVILEPDSPAVYYLRGVHDATKRDPDLRKEIQQVLAVMRDRGRLRLVFEHQNP